MIQVVKEGINMNLADLCTKILPMVVRRFCFRGLRTDIPEVEPGSLNVLWHLVFPSQNHHRVIPTTMEPNFEQENFDTTCLSTCSASYCGDCSIKGLNGCVLSHLCWHIWQHTC
jgi:hypothetical protein